MSPVTLSSSVLTAAPGRNVGCDVHLTNPGADVVTFHVEVDGPAAEWAVVLPTTLVLAPGASGRARATFTVPDGERAAGSTRSFAVRVTGSAPMEVAGRIEVAEVQDLRVSISPLVTRGRRSTTHTVSVENRGTGPGRVALAARETAGTLECHLAQGGVSLAPGEQASVDVTVVPSRRLLRGRSRPHPFTVEARPETGPPVIAAATRFQDPVRWRRGIVAGASVLTVAAAGAFALRSGPRPDATLLAGGAAPVTRPALTSSCPEAGTAEPRRVDIAGFAYCPATPTVPVGTEVVWTNADLAPHTVTYDGPEGPVDSGSMVQGQSWSTRFGHAGTYRYYCRFHPGMEGTIVVASVG